MKSITALSFVIFACTSADQTSSVEQADTGGSFSVNPGNSNPFIAQTGTSTQTVTVSPFGGYVGTVNLSMTLLPANTMATFDPPSVTITDVTSKTSQLTITTSNEAAGGYTVDLRGDDSLGSTFSFTEMTLTVQAADFSFFVSPSSRTVSRGGTASYLVDVSRFGGFDGTVALSLAGAPPSSTWTFTPSSLPLGTAESSLAVHTTHSTPRATYHLTVTGTSGSLSHSVPATLIVN